MDEKNEIINKYDEENNNFNKSNKKNKQNKTKIIILFFINVLLLLIIIFSFIFYLNSKNKSDQIQLEQFINNIDIEYSKNNISSLSLEIKEEALNTSTLISKEDVNKLVYNFKDKINDREIYLHYDEENNKYVSNIKDLDINDEKEIINYINNNLITYVEDICFYENHLTILNKVSYSFISKEAIKIASLENKDNYLIVNKYGLINEFNYNNTLIKGNYVVNKEKC